MSVHRTFPPPAGGIEAVIQTQYSQTMQTDIVKYFIFIYIYRIYNHKNLYVQLIWQEIKWATLSKLNFVLFWGVFITEIRFFSVSWVDVGMWFSRSLCVTSQGRAPVSQVCGVSVSAIVSHSLEIAAEMKENLNLFRQDRTPEGTRCGRTVKNSEQRQK